MEAAIEYTGPFQCSEFMDNVYGGRIAIRATSGTGPHGTLLTLNGRWTRRTTSLLTKRPRQNLPSDWPDAGQGSAPREVAFRKRRPNGRTVGGRFDSAASERTASQAP